MTIDTRSIRIAAEKALSEMPDVKQDIIALCDELDAAKRDAERYQELCVNPVGGSHLLNLLAAGKGDQASLDNMIDRIRKSRLGAIQKGIDAAIEQEKQP